MSDLISREALKEALKEAHANFELTFDINTYGEVINIINNAPTVDISKEVWNKSNELLNKRLSYLERPQGKWVDVVYTNKGCGVGMCNQCGSHRIIDNFCPNCGADMRGD